MNDSISNLADKPANCGVDEAQVQGIRRILVKLAKARRGRAHYLPSELLGEPAWDILLELLLARLERRRTLVKGAVLASGVPMTTALRYIKQLERHGLLVRNLDPKDGRYVLLSISSTGEEALLNWLKDQKLSDLHADQSEGTELWNRNCQRKAGRDSLAFFRDVGAFVEIAPPFRMPLASFGSPGIHYRGGHAIVHFEGGIHGCTHGQTGSHSAARTSLE